MSFFRKLFRMQSTQEDDKVEFKNPFTHVQALKAHNDIVRVILKIDEKRVASCSDDGTIVLWDWKTSQRLCTLKGHSSRVDCLLYLTDGVLASASSDKTVMLWDIYTGRCIKTLKGHEAGVKFMCILDSERFCSGGNDDKLCVWRIRSYFDYTTRQQQSRQQHNETNNSEVAYPINYNSESLSNLVSPNAKKRQDYAAETKIEAVDEDLINVIERKDVESVTGMVVVRYQKPLLTPVVDSNNANFSSVFQNDTLIVTAVGSKLLVYSTSRYSLIQTITHHKDHIRSLVKINDCAFVTGSLDGTAIVWSTNVVASAASGSNDSTASFSAPASSQQLPNGKASIPLVQIARIIDIQKMYRADNNSNIYNLQQLIVVNERYLCAAINNDFCAYDLETGDCLLRTLGKPGHQAHNAKVISLLSLYYGGVIVSCSADSCIRLWDTKKRLSRNRDLSIFSGDADSQQQYYYPREFVDSGNLYDSYYQQYYDSYYNHYLIETTSTSTLDSANDGAGSEAAEAADSPTRFTTTNHWTPLRRNTLHKGTGASSPATPFNYSQQSLPSTPPATPTTSASFATPSSTSGPPIEPVCIGELYLHTDTVNQLVALSEHSFASCAAQLLLLWKDGRVENRRRNLFSQLYLTALSARTQYYNALIAHNEQMQRYQQQLQQQQQRSEKPPRTPSAAAAAAAPVTPYLRAYSTVDDVDDRFRGIHINVDDSNSTNEGAAIPVNGSAVSSNSSGELNKVSSDDGSSMHTARSFEASGGSETSLANHVLQSRTQQQQQQHSTAATTPRRHFEDITNTMTAEEYNSCASEADAFVDVSESSDIDNDDADINSGSNVNDDNDSKVLNSGNDNSSSNKRLSHSERERVDDRSPQSATSDQSFFSTTSSPGTSANLDRRRKSNSTSNSNNSSKRSSLRSANASLDAEDSLTDVGVTVNVLDSNM